MLELIERLRDAFQNDDRMEMDDLYLEILKAGGFKEALRILDELKGGKK